jgi:hypothetical protein
MAAAERPPPPPPASHGHDRCRGHGHGGGRCDHRGASPPPPPPPPPQQQQQQQQPDAESPPPGGPPVAECWACGVLIAVPYVDGGLAPVFRVRGLFVCITCVDYMCACQPI